MKFFTDKTVKNDYLLVKLPIYLKMKDFNRWKEVFVDPGVYDLTKSDKFKWEGKINIPEFLDGLPDNHYFSWDYPGDMNLQYQDLFLQKTWDNALKYSKHPQYIVTVQFKFNHYWSFVSWFNKYNELEIKSGILGLGNMCKTCYKPIFMHHALDYALSHCNHKKIHIYGLPLRFMKYVFDLGRKFNIEVTVGSTKWSFYFYDKDYERGGGRQKAFDWYLNKIKEKGVVLENG